MKDEKATEVKFEDIYKPLHYDVVLRLKAEKNTAGGLIIPDHLVEHESFVEVVAVGPKVEHIKTGDLVRLAPETLGFVFEVQGTEYCQVESLRVKGIVNKEFKHFFKHSTQKLTAPKPQEIN